MTRDGLAAIHVYTQESALYSMLNKILRSRGEERKTALSPFMQYHKLLMTALSQVWARLPTAPAIKSSRRSQDLCSTHVDTERGIRSAVA